LSGQLVGGAPWTREVIRQRRHRDPATIAALEAKIPDGHSVLLIPANGNYGSWVGVLVEGFREIARSPQAAPSITAAAYAAIHAGVGRG
jgi:hypothetical protein